MSMDRRNRWLNRVSDFLTGSPKPYAPDPSGAAVVGQSGASISIDGRPVEVSMGGQTFVVLPELSIDPQCRRPPLTLIVLRRAALEGHLVDFARIEPGATLTIDPFAAALDDRYGHPGDAVRCSIGLRHDGAALVVKPTPDPECRVRVVDAEPDANARLGQRLEALRAMRKLLDATFESNTPSKALDSLKAVNALLAKEPSRSVATSGRPGAIVELPAHCTPIVVGDLHGCVDNLLTVLSHNGVWQSLEEGTGTLVLLGDAVHPEEGALGDMQGSATMMDLIVALKARFPRGVHMVVGNHDSFSSELMKNGVAQGMLWSRYLTEHRGAEYRREMQRFYDRSPLLAIGDDLICCHAGPPRTSFTRQMLVDAHDNPTLLHELTWNRQKTPGYAGGYTADDVDRLRQVLSRGADAALIVGHYPRSETGTVWMDAGSVRRHHVVVSSRSDTVAVVLRVRGDFVAQTYPCEPIRDLVAGGGVRRGSRHAS